MIIEKETNTIHLRMGDKYKFVSSVVLNDGTRLVNMQCSLLAPTPTKEELQKLDDESKRNFRLDTEAEMKKLSEIYEKVGIKNE